MKKFVISEKPSVAADLSKVLGQFKKFDDRYENNEYVISWAVGHLVELFMPEDFDTSLKRWALKTLPIIPEKFKTKPIEKVKKRFNELKKLMQRDDIDLLINGCDAGREGELIFTYIYELVKSKKPFKRLWLSSMTAQGIGDAFKNLRSSDEMQNLQDAAKCRSEADWLIGINGTRAITTKMFSIISKQVATVGRVQTPTLAMIVNRDHEINNFKPAKYWKISGKFAISEGKYDGILQKSQKLSDNPHDRSDRLWANEEALKIIEAIKDHKIATVSEQKKRIKQSSPRLYDLTTLQREANTRYNMPANMTLQVAQSLYEKHKCITYPRTDSRALTEDYVDTCYKILAAVNNEDRIFAQRVIEAKAVHGGNKKIFNNKQISDHFAIIPTPQPPKNLTEVEAKIFSMILKRFICVFYPDAEFDTTTRMSTVQGYSFKTEGKILAVAGWMEVYGKGNAQEETLPALTTADGTPPQAEVLEVEIIEDETRPPASYNEATLLSSMEGAGKLLDDEDLADAMKERGLGTPATRAQIIEHLLALKYLVRDNKNLKATVKAEDLLNFLKAAKIETLSSPAMTGEWEYKLRQMENGTFSRKNFMKEISDLTIAIVDKTKNFVEGSDTTKETTIISPTDGKPLMEGLRSYRSNDGKLTIQKIIGGKKLSEEEIQELLINKKIGPLSGFKSRTGSDFSATLVLDDSFRINFVFEKSAAEGEIKPLSKEEIDGLEVIGKCPFDGADVVAADGAYICKNYFNKKCKLRISKKMLDKDISLEQMQKLLIGKKTDLLEGFRSKRTGKLFSARLVLQNDGKIRFEFK
ncbi:MAG: DNA topoisomerase 3 [Puniceicoccales bacterium]|jgi:DNA topoisomerase-3|nr:DNA topoisomerase 3 [Puniceicoccales bacterium]